MSSLPQFSRSATKALLGRCLRLGFLLLLLLLLLGGRSRLWGAGPGGPGITFAGAPFVLAGVNGLDPTISPLGMVIDGKGNLFVVDGKNNQIVEVNPYGSASILSIPGVTFSSPIALAVDAAETLYVSDLGGPGDTGRIVMVPNTGSATVLSVLDSSSHPLSFSPVGLAVDQAGTMLFLADGTTSYIWKVSLSSGGPATLINGPALALNTSLVGMALGTTPTTNPTPYLYITDPGNSRIVAYDPSSPMTTAIFFTASELQTPGGLALDQMGNLYVSDLYSNSVLAFLSPSQTTVSRVNAGSLNFPAAIAVNGEGDVFIADNGNGRVVEVGMTAVDLGAVAIGAQAEVSLPFAYQGNPIIGSIQVLTQGQAGQVGHALAFTQNATLSTMATSVNSASAATGTVAVKFQPASPGLFTGAVVIYDGPTSVPLASVAIYGTGLGQLAAFSPSAPASVLPSTGMVVQNFAQPGMDGAGNMYFVSGGTGTPPGQAQLAVLAAGGGTVSQVALPSGVTQPEAVAVDPAGNLYLADGSKQIFKLPISTLSYQLGSPWPSSVLPLTLTGTPWSLAVDLLGNLYVATSDGSNTEILKVNAQGTQASSVWPGTGSTLTSNGPITGLAVAQDGTLYFADPDGGKVVKITPAGQATDASTGWTWPTGVTQPLRSPTGVTMDPLGNLYISDQGNNRVLVVTTAGVVSVLAAPGQAITSPTGVLVDGSGQVIVLNQFSDPSLPPPSTFYGLLQVPITQAPTLTFTNGNPPSGATPVGTTSSDSPQTVVVTNLGNQGMAFAQGPFANNGQIYPASNFLSNVADPNLIFPPTIGISSSGTTLAPGTAGDVSVVFKPSSSGSLNTAIALTSFYANTFNNAFGPLQTINCSGVGSPGQAALALAVNASLSQASDPVSFTATLTGPGVTPTGTVTFWDASATPPVALGTGTLNASGVATLTTSSLAAGSHDINASYAPPSGNSDYSALPATSDLFVQITGAPATFTVSGVTDGSPSAPSTMVTFTATVAGQAPPTPTGSVTFLVNGTQALQTAPLVAGVATSTLAPLPPWLFPPGTYTITASYSGDAFYEASNSTPIVQTIYGSWTPSVTLSASATAAPPSTPMTFTATVTSPPGSPTPTGTVTFLDGSTVLNAVPAPLSASGVATFVTSSLAAGPHAVIAFYNGDANYASGWNSLPVAVSVSISPFVTTLSLSSLGATYQGDPVTLVATVTSASGTPPTGFVTFSEGGMALGTVQLQGGSASFIAQNLPLGTDPITAVYSGDPSDLASLASLTGANALEVTSPVILITAAPPVTVPSGGSVTTSLTLASLGNVGGPVTLTVTGLPANVALTFATNPITIVPGTPVTLSGTLTAAAPAPVDPGATPASAGGIGAALLAFGLLLLPGLGRKWMGMAAALAVVLVCSLLACHSSTSSASPGASLQSAAAPGAYEVTVTASAAGAVQATATFQLTVASPGAAASAYSRKIPK